MTTESTRQGMLILFMIMIVFVGPYFLEMTYFQSLLISSIAALIVKLTDIQDEIARVRWKK